MADIADVIKALACCIKIDEEGNLTGSCYDCPFRAQDWNGKVACEEFGKLNVDIPWKLAKDALDLLNAHAPAVPVIYDPTAGRVKRFGYCGACHNALRIWKKTRDNYCSNCGRKVDWDAVD